MIDAPTYPQALESFYDSNLITSHPELVKSGKEGTVYRCRAHPSTGVELFAAKIYRPREHRTFHNDAIYNEGRAQPDKRLQRAIAKKSRTGREAQFSAWVDHEYEAMTRLHAAGADVPYPIARADSAILMAYVGDETGPASLLRQVALKPDEVRPLLRRVLDNVELFLAHDHVHGDLSAFNILYHAGRITIIDFPQSVDPRSNPNAQNLLTRDLDNVYAYWRRYGIEVNPTLFAHDLWQRYLGAQL